MKASSRRKLAPACSLLVAMVLLAGLPSAAPAKQAAPPVDLPVFQAAALPAPSTPPQGFGSPNCPHSALSLIATPSFSKSSSAVTGDSTYAWNWKDASHTQIFANVSAMAGYMSFLQCYFDSSCVMQNFLQHFYFNANAYADATLIDMAVRYDGPPNSTALVKGDAAVDGLLLGAAAILAEAHSRGVANLSIRTPDGPYQITDIDITKYSYIAQQFREHITGYGRGSGTTGFFMDNGEEAHMTGWVRAESSVTSTAAGASAGFSLFEHQSLVTIDEVKNPGMTTTFYIYDTIPTISAEKSSVKASQGRMAANQGAYCDGDMEPVKLTASLGTVVDNQNGTWSWSYDTTGAPTGSQAVTIQVIDTRHSFVRKAVFTLVVGGPQDQKQFLPFIHRPR